VSPWKLPPANLLKRSESSKVDPQLVQDGGEVLEATMRQFGVDARLLGATVGPTVTRYELELAPGVKVNKVTSLSKEIAYSMASHDVRILAPIPGRSAIGVEVPNKMRPVVTLGDILASPEAKKAKHPLEVAMGRDIAGNAVMVNLASFPHVLIAGQTGAGKSSCINSIVTSLLARTTPDQVRLILVDPKRVELGQYNSVPHLLTEVVTNPKRAANALDWAVREMEMRYDVLADIGARDITGYNAMFDRGDLPTADDPDPETGKSYERLPFIVVVVDELADLMMVAARDVETSISRLAAMARAVGIHLVIATQRPSVDVITGVIKANIPSRLAFSVSTLADSRVILDQMGAEKLIGKGDMLMLTASSSRTERVQGAWVDEECVRKVVAHWRRQVTETTYVEGVQGADGAGGGRSGNDDGDSDDLFDEAMELVVRAGTGSTSMLQRKLRVGFARAGRLMDLLETRGVVGPSEGSKSRVVLMTVDELEEMSTKA
jgi:S-DNA-T family DNA segregation ATPase FtsK/SpoIIIE